MKLRNHLNRILFERGLAEGELASVCRLDQGHLNRIKNGRVNPNLVTALRISRALGLPVGRVFYLDGWDAPAADGADSPRPNARAERSATGLGTSDPAQRRVRPASDSSACYESFGRGSPRRSSR